MNLELKPGEAIAVTFAGVAGEIKLAFTASQISVTADVPDHAGRIGAIYALPCDPLGLASQMKLDPLPVQSSHMLSTEQVEARNESLVRNMRFKWPQVLETYPDDVIVKSFDQWYEQAENVGDGYEWAFMGFLPGFEDGLTYPQWQAQMERQRRNREAEASQAL